MRKYLENKNGHTMKVFEYTCEFCGIFFKIEIPADEPISDNDLDKVLEFESAWKSHEHGSHEYREYSPLIEVIR